VVSGRGGVELGGVVLSGAQQRPHEARQRLCRQVAPPLWVVHLQDDPGIHFHASDSPSRHERHVTNGLVRVQGLYYGGCSLKANLSASVCVCVTTYVEGLVQEGLEGHEAGGGGEAQVQVTEVHCVVLEGTGSRRHCKYNTAVVAVQPCCPQRLMSLQTSLWECVCVCVWFLA